MDNHFKILSRLIANGNTVEAYWHIFRILPPDHFNEKQLAELLSKISLHEKDRETRLSTSLLEKHPSLWHKNTSDIFLYSVLVDRSRNLLLDKNTLNITLPEGNKSLAVAVHKQDINLIAEALKLPRYHVLERHQIKFFAEKIAQIITLELTKTEPNYSQLSGLLKILEKKSGILSGFPQEKNPLDIALDKAHAQLKGSNKIDPALEKLIVRLSKHTKGAYQNTRRLNFTYKICKTLSKVPALLTQPLLKRMEQLTPILERYAILKDIQKKKHDSCSSKKNARDYTK
eukprot:TRINITY_DN19737_c0_g1_i1.p1 TRINITY_DN19737_c0_g1~~TRINITY_DN19737_c0_g1_i1.p1  ORF type:complete len:287 (+),score=-58.08 TRINITY_DN19737_c0_g1_i1:17-877(+)